MKSPILVTGSHRSGSTWVGKILSTGHDIGYIYEPFNIGRTISANPKHFKYWFQYIPKETQGEYKLIFEKILSFDYPLYQNISRSRTPKHLAKTIIDNSQFWLYKTRNVRPLLKDPISIYSCEWLHETFNIQPVVIIRHPAAFCSSLKVANWPFDFRNFLEQPLLMEQYLFPFRDQIQEYSNNSKSVVEQSILLWNCIHYTIDLYQKNYDTWSFVKHENLSRNPIQEFEELCKKLHINFTKEIKTTITNTTGSHNPSEQDPNNLGKIKRNSKENIQNWKNRLSSDEISMIKDRTYEISSLFYSTEDW